MMSFESFMTATEYDNEEYYLLGHALGGYLATLYALKRPEKIIKLILCTPLGIPRKPVNF